jgi:hypothetical protein
MSADRAGVRTMLLILGMPAVLAVLYYGYLAVKVAGMPFTRAQMDWDGDGRTSWGEYFATADVIQRPDTSTGRPCTALVNARTGSTIRVDCDSAPAATP